MCLYTWNEKSLWETHFSVHFLLLFPLVWNIACRRAGCPTGWCGSLSVGWHGLYPRTKLQKCSVKREHHSISQCSHSPCSNRSSRDMRGLVPGTCNTEIVLMWRRHTRWHWSGLWDHSASDRMWEEFYVILWAGSPSNKKKWVCGQSVVSQLCMLAGEGLKLRKSSSYWGGRLGGEKLVQFLSFLELFALTWGLCFVFAFFKNNSLNLVYVKEKKKVP